MESLNLNTYFKNVTTKAFFNKPIWRVNDVAQVLGVTEGHIYNLVNKSKKMRNKDFPFRKKGKLLFFIPEEILNWISEGEIENGSQF